MEQIVRSYNLGINYLQAEKFEEAALFLEPLVKEYPSFAEAKWALGLLYVLSGFPHKALSLWKHLEDDDLQSIVEKMPQYEELYFRYNLALQLVQADNIEEAKAIFAELLANQKEVPLPVDFYQAYLLAEIVTGNVNGALKAISDFPLYVKKYSVIRDPEKSLTGTLKVQETQQPEPEKPIIQEERKKGWCKNLLVASGMAASLLIGAVAMWSLSETKAKDTAQPVVQQNTAESAKESEKSAALEKELSALKEENAQLEQKVAAKETELSKQQELTTIISYADLNREELSSKAGLNTYKKGLAAFKTGNYDEAADLMEKSIALQPNEYFSDDALYFLIKSTQRLNKLDELPALYDRFFTQTGGNYTLSPYRDDLLLSKAQLLIKNGNIQEALPLLETIRTEYKQEWTAEEATLMINKLLGGPKND